MTIVQVINVSIVFNASVSTVRAVLVIMIFVCMAHRILRDEGGGKCLVSHSEIRSGIFHRVHDSVGHQSRDMSISQAVKDVLTLSPRRDNPFAFKDPQTL